MKSEKEKARQKKYYEQNKARIQEKAREYYRQNRDVCLSGKKKYYQEHKEEMLERNKKYSRSPIAKQIKQAYHVKNRNIPELRFTKSRQQAKTRNILWSLTKDFYCMIVKTPCYYCDDQLGDTKENCGVGLDRIDNSKGYENNNVVSCCAKCNFVRGTVLTPEETRIAIQAVLQYRKGKT